MTSCLYVKRLNDLIDSFGIVESMKTNVTKPWKYHRTGKMDTATENYLVSMSRFSGSIFRPRNPSSAFLPNGSLNSGTRSPRVARRSVGVAVSFESITRRNIDTRVIAGLKDNQG